HLFTVSFGPMKLEGYGPEDQVIMVSFSSIKAGLPYDPACEVSPGEHPFIVKGSYIYYREPRIYSVSHVQTMVASGVWTEKPICDAGLIEKIRAGFLTSKRLPRHYKVLLESL